MNTRDPEQLYSLAETMTSEGRYAAAELMLRQAVELAGDKSEIYASALAALIGMQEGRTEESLKIIENQLLARPDNPNLLVAYSLTVRAAGMAEEAEASLRQVLDKRSDHPLALHTLATVLTEKGELEEAEVLACRAFMLVPDHPDFALVAIELLEAQGKPEQAYEVASLGASLNPHEMDLVSKALEGALARQEPDRAWEVLKDSDNDLPWVVGWKATLLDHQGNSAEADKMMAAGRASFGDDISYLVLEAAIWARRGKPDEVKPLVERVLKMEPTNRAALRLRADYTMQHSPELAVSDLESVYFEDPDDMQVAIELIAAYYKCKRYRDTLDVCLHWEEIQRANPTKIVLPPQFHVYSTLASASLGDTKDTLWRSDWIPDEFLVDSITEMNTYGCGELAEDKLRFRLTDRLPEVIPVDPFEEKPDEPLRIDGELAEVTPEMLEEERLARAKEATIGTPIARPTGDPHDTYNEISEDEDDDEEWVWVDDDEDEEDDDEEYVWVEVDEDEDDDDAEYEWVDAE